MNSEAWTGLYRFCGMRDLKTDLSFPQKNLKCVRILYLQFPIIRMLSIDFPHFAL